MAKQVTVTMSWRQAGLVARAAGLAPPEEDKSNQNEIDKAIKKLLLAAERRLEILTTTDADAPYTTTGGEVLNG